MRADLAHRLAGIVIDVPPLADRPEDIPVLARHFAHLAARERGGIAELTRGAIEELLAYPWPGNVRELRHTIERAVVLAGRVGLRREDVVAALQGPRQRARGAAGDLAARRALINVLEASQWDTARAAERLGWHRATVYRRMKRLGIEVPVRPSSGSPSVDSQRLRTEAS